jgi:hypothetical protein
MEYIFLLKNNLQIFPAHWMTASSSSSGYPACLGAQATGQIASEYYLFHCSDDATAMTAIIYQLLITRMNASESAGDKDYGYVMKERCRENIYRQVAS